MKPKRVFAGVGLGRLYEQNESVAVRRLLDEADVLFDSLPFTVASFDRQENATEFLAQVPGVLMSGGTGTHSGLNLHVKTLARVLRASRVRVRREKWDEVLSELVRGLEIQISGERTDVASAGITERDLEDLVSVFGPEDALRDLSNAIDLSETLGSAADEHSASSLSERREVLALLARHLPDHFASVTYDQLLGGKPLFRVGNVWIAALDGSSALAFQDIAGRRLIDCLGPTIERFRSARKAQRLAPIPRASRYVRYCGARK